MGLKAAIYVRQSQDRANDGEAITRQLEACRYLAESKGWDVVATYCDNDTSASGNKVRPEYAKAMAALADRSIDALVVPHIDRLARKMRDLEDIVDVCESTGARIATVNGDIDLSNDSGRLVARILAAVARAEIERKSDRQRKANRQRVESGRVDWVHRPYGYDKQDGDVVLVDAEAAVIRDMAARFLAGDTVASIVRHLNAAGTPTSTGSRWTVISARRVLANPRHAGHATYRGEQVGEGDWPTILDPATHQAILDRLTDPRRFAHLTEAKVRSLLSGIAVCGECGGPCYPQTRVHRDRTRHRAYVCREAGHVGRRIDRVDPYVTAVLLARLTDPRMADAWTTGEDLDRLRSDRHELVQRRDGIAELRAAGLLSQEAALTQARALADRIADVDRQLAEVAGSSDAAAVATAGDPVAVWDALPLRSRRGLVRAFLTVTLVKVGKGSRELGVKFEPRQV